MVIAVSFRVAVIELLLGRNKKIIGCECRKRNNEDERKEQREVLRLPHETPY